MVDHMTRDVEVRDEQLQRVEDSLHTILSELDSDEMEADERIKVESACEKIHIAFGGDSAEAIYQDLTARK